MRFAGFLMMLVTGLLVFLAAYQMTRNAECKRPNGQWERCWK